MMHHCVARCARIAIGATPASQPISRRIVRRCAVRGRRAMPPLEYTEPVVVPPRVGHTATVILLHGLGDTADGWKPVAGPELWGERLPKRPVTLNMGFPFTAWYDVASLRSEDNRTDEDGIAESYRYLSELIDKEIQNGIPSDRIAIAGFSQGGAMALTMLRSPLKFAGILGPILILPPVISCSLGMSSYLPICKDIPIVSDINKATPVMMCHGTYDPTIAFIYGQQSFNLLEKELQNIQFKEYPHGHEVSDDQLRETRAFLESVLPQT